MSPELAPPVIGQLAPIASDHSPDLASQWALLNNLWPILISAIDDRRFEERSRGKAPLGGKGWGLVRQDRRWFSASYKRNKGANVGLLLGPRGGVVDIDVDDPEKAAPILERLFPDGIPSTLGWKNLGGKFHLLFRWDDRLLKYVGKTGVIKDGPNYPGLELRLGGGEKQIQSVIPPSLLPNGQKRVWNGNEIILPLPESFFADLEKYGANKKLRTATPAADPGPRPSHGNAADVVERASRYLAKCDPAIDGDDGSGKCLWAACKMVEFGLDYDTCLRLLMTEYNPRCKGPWSEEGMRHKLDSAFEKAERGAMLKAGQNGHHGPNGVAVPIEFNGHAATNGDGYHQPADAPKDEKPSIQCNNTGLAYATNATMKALAFYNEPPQLFNTGGSLSRLKMTVGDDPRPVIDLMSGDALRNRMAEVAVFYETHETKNEVKRRVIFPPRDIVKAIMAQAAWSEKMAPQLNSIAETPRFGRDGKLITTAGFHPNARLYYAPLAGLEDMDIPLITTADQVDEAKAFIFDEYLVNFPFADPASKANALACMLLPFVRAMIDGPTPLHMVEASTEGTGKGKLSNALAFPASGHDLTSTPQKEDEAEWRKAITTALVSGVETIYFDNMYNPKGWDDTLLPIDSGTLAAVLTQPIWRDRILGVTKDATVPIRAVFMGSGNNLEWSKELKRRIVPITLKAPIENPSERTGFKHDPLEEWARQNHRELLRACLILCQNWIAEDRPKGKQVMGSYEAYVKVMGGILDAALVTHFLGNLPKGSGKDRESVRWSALVETWHEKQGSIPTSSADLHGIIFGIGTPPVGGNPALQIAFADMGEGSVLSQKQRLGNALRKQEGRVWGQHRIVLSAAKGSGGTLLYKLVAPDDDSEGELL